MSGPELVVFDAPQGSDEWLRARLGLVTASVVGALVTPGTLRVASNEGARTLTLSLVAERIVGRSEPVHVSDDMMRGQLDEPLARDWYAENHGAVTETGLMVRTGEGWRLGYSPDGLVGDDGLIEIKSRRPKKHLKTILDGKPPVENLAQMHAGMLVTGRKWCDYISWCGGMPPYVTRAQADPAWDAVLIEALQTFEQLAQAALVSYEALTDGMEPSEFMDYFNDDIRI